MTPETLAALTGLLGALAGFWRWVRTRLDQDRERLEALELERSARFVALEARLDTRESEGKEMIRALARAEAALELTRLDLTRAISALNSERVRPCPRCGHRRAQPVTGLDEITEEML